MQLTVKEIFEQNIQAFKRIESLELSINTALDEIKTLKLENKILKLENIKLQDKLGLNSTNSSLPPSKDLYKSKTTVSLTKSDKRPGAQPGHSGAYRKQLPPDHIVEW